MELSRHCRMTLSIPIIFNHCPLISYWCLVFWLFLSQKNDDSDDEGLLDELELEEEDEDVVVAVEQPIDGCSQDGDELKELRQRKDELTQRHLDQQRRKQQLRVYRIFFSSSLKTRWLTFSFQAILRERVQVELEVRPKLLVADTNCYIDHLDALMSLTREKHYTLVAPLVGTLYNRFAGGNTRKIWSWLSPRQKKKRRRRVCTRVRNPVAVSRHRHLDPKNTFGRLGVVIVSRTKTTTKWGGKQKESEWKKKKFLLFVAFPRLFTCSVGDVVVFCFFSTTERRSSSKIFKFKFNAELVFTIIMMMISSLPWGSLWLRGVASSSSPLRNTMESRHNKPPHFPSRSCPGRPDVSHPLGIPP